MNAEVWPPKAIDPEHVVVTEAVQGSAIPVHLMYVEAVDGAYVPIALRKPAGGGPLPHRAVRDRQWRRRHGDAARPRP